MHLNTIGLMKKFVEGHSSDLNISKKVKQGCWFTGINYQLFLVAWKGGGRRGIVLIVSVTGFHCQSCSVYTKKQTKMTAQAKVANRERL